MSNEILTYQELVGNLPETNSIFSESELSFKIRDSFDTIIFPVVEPTVKQAVHDIHAFETNPGTRFIVYPGTVGNQSCLTQHKSSKN